MVSATPRSTQNMDFWVLCSKLTRLSSILCSSKTAVVSNIKFRHHKSFKILIKVTLFNVNLFCFQHCLNIPVFQPIICLKFANIPHLELLQGSKLTLANSQNASDFDNLGERKISTSKHLLVRIIHVSPKKGKNLLVVSPVC